MEVLESSKQVNFIKSFYTLSAIKNSIETYKDFLKISINENDENYILNFQSLDNEFKLQNLIDEFSNYVLSQEFQNK